jgi:ADP-ribosyl-[dinitrogen reductase] hydrolase
MNKPFQRAGVSLRDRFVGALVGLACGDAVGTTVEFSLRGTFDPVVDMVGGGPFELSPGEWTDDTSMALCLAESLLHCGGFDARDQMNRYVNWWRWGYLSSTGSCFDIGSTTRRALARYEETMDPFAGDADPMAAGNGSLMRLAPVALFFHPDEAQVVRHSAESSRTTHAAPEALACCRLLGLALSRALAGVDKHRLLEGATSIVTEPAMRAIVQGAYRDKARAAISGSGYCVASLEAALWCFERTDSFAKAVLAAVNLGDDADTTGAITGQLAGAYYGVHAIPEHWRERLALRDEIVSLGERLHDAHGTVLNSEDS